eukprot:792032-Heterocapsa_arctica.AAC.1
MCTTRPQSGRRKTSRSMRKSKGSLKAKDRTTRGAQFHRQGRRGLEMYKLCKVFPNSSRLEETSQNPMQDQEEDQSSQVEDSCPQKEVATESGTEDQPGGPLGKPHTQE